MRFDDHFEDVRPGTTVTMVASLRNDRLAPMRRSVRVPTRMVLRDQSGARLTSNIFEVLIPGRDGGSCDE